MVLQIHDDPLLSVSRSQLSSSDLGASDSVGLLSACDYNPHSHHTLQVSEHCDTTAHSHMQPLISSHPGFSVRYPYIIYLYLSIYYITGQREMERFCKGPMCQEAFGGQVTGKCGFGLGWGRQTTCRHLLFKLICNNKMLAAELLADIV